MHRTPSFAFLLAFLSLIAGCSTEGPTRSEDTSPPQPVAVDSDLDLAVSSEVSPGGKLSGFVHSSHPPVYVEVLSRDGDDLPTVGLGSPDERNCNFSTEVPNSYEFDVILVTAHDGRGAKVTKKVRVVR